MYKNNNYCIILAGGTGSKLWPLSRSSRPKQFLDIENSGRSLLRHTFDRFLRILPPENIIVVSSYQYADIVKEQLPELPEKNLLLEPYSRNTAPSIAYATYTILLRCPDAKIVVTPSDNSISSRTEFSDTVRKVLDFISENDYLVTLGIVPTGADVNFGYIQMTGGKKSVNSDLPVKVKTFTEKPDRDLAQVFIDSGEFLWNSGVIIAHADSLRREIEKNNPELTKLFAGWEGALGTRFEKDFIGRVYTDCTSKSFDYSILDKTDNAWVQPCHFNWMDIGNWGSIYNYLIDKDKDGNAAASCQLLCDESSGNLIVSTIGSDNTDKHTDKRIDTHTDTAGTADKNVTADGKVVADGKMNTPESDGADRRANVGGKKKLVAVKGLDNFMIVDTPDVLMICPRDGRDFKEVLSILGMPGYEDFR